MASSKWVRGNWRTSLPTAEKNCFMEIAESGWVTCVSATKTQRKTDLQRYPPSLAAFKCYNTALSRGRRLPIRVKHTDSRRTAEVGMATVDEQLALISRGADEIIQIEHRGAGGNDGLKWSPVCAIRVRRFCIAATE